MKILTIVLFAISILGCKDLKQQNFSLIEIKNDHNEEKESMEVVQSAMTTNGQDFFVGQGYNSATTELKGRVVAYNPEDELVTVDQSEGQVLDFYFDRVQSMEELRNTLEVNVVASFKLGLANADARSNYFRQVNFNSYNDYLCAKVTVRNPAKQLLRRDLTVEARRRMGDGQDEFMRFAGDEYIKGIQTGGQVILLYQFTSSSSTERESLRVSLTTSIGTFLSSAKTSTDMSKALESLKGFKNTKVFLYRVGDNSQISEDPDALINYINHFPEIMSDRRKSAILNFITEPIANLEGVPSQNRNFDKIYMQKRFVRSGLEQMLTLQNIINNIDYKKNNLASFPKDNIDILNNDQSKIKRFLEQDRICLEDCIYSFNNCGDCMLSDDVLEVLDKHNAMASAVVPKIITVPYKAENDWLPIIDTKSKFYIVNISGTWYNVPEGNAGGHPLKGFIDQFGNNVWGATLQLRDMTDHVISEWRFSGDEIIMDKPNTRLFLRTFVTDPYRNNAKIKVYSSNANPIKIICY